MQPVTAHPCLITTLGPSLSGPARSWWVSFLSLLAFLSLFCRALLSGTVCTLHRKLC